MSQTPGRSITAAAACGVLTIVQMSDIKAAMTLVIV
jgi:hypothetical protein